MSQADLETALDQRIRTMRIIVFALLNGIVIFMAIAIFLRTSGRFVEPRDSQMISPVALIFGVVMFVVHLVVPNLLAAQARRQIALGKWAGRTPTGRVALLPGDL